MQSVIQTTYADFSSETATQLMARQECDLARRYLDQAIPIYKNDSYDNSNEQYFTQPLFLASCYLIKSGHSNYKDLSLRDEAIKYKNIANDARIALKFRIR